MNALRIFAILALFCLCTAHAVKKKTGFVVVTEDDDVEQVAAPVLPKAAAAPVASPQTPKTTTEEVTAEPCVDRCPWAPPPRIIGRLNHMRLESGEAMPAFIESFVYMSSVESACITMEQWLAHIANSKNKLIDDPNRFGFPTEIRIARGDGGDDPMIITQPFLQDLLNVQVKCVLRDNDIVYV